MNWDNLERDDRTRAELLAEYRDIMDERKASGAYYMSMQWEYYDSKLRHLGRLITKRTLEGDTTCPW